MVDKYLGGRGNYSQIIMPARLPSMYERRRSFAECSEIGKSSQGYDLQQAILKQSIDFSNGNLTTKLDEEG